MIKVLIVDDSKLVQSLIAEIVNSVPDMTVVGTADDPYDAREKIKALNPDVLTLDVEMPKMDGVTFLKNLMRLRPMPVIMLSTLTAEGAPITLQALEIGAVDFLEKPKANLAQALPRYTALLQDKIRAASVARVRPFSEKKQEPSERLSSLAKNWQHLSFKANHLVAIGASTGGTEAIKEVVTKLPAHFPPVVITQHIPPVFSTTFANRLDLLSAMKVYEAEDGQKIEHGCIYLAPGDEHLKVVAKGSSLYCKLEHSEPVNRHRPSVDVMFDSLPDNIVKNCTAVILTGMGADGAAGLKRLKDMGALTLTQSESTCVVYGMPKAADDMGASTKSVALDKMTQALVQAAVKK
ncbi:MAG: chemotaxis response regulator protein-glutamate methylesterase [Gammaproteobacteria bacterium]|nr:chemotaxis response regulator protein-glutamate methylesterase [Gammaproteobacteria bacterium]